MKKILFAIGALILLVVIALVAAPVFFKDDIKQAIDKAIAENVNANVYYDIDGLELSFFKSFPDLSVTISDFGVSGKGSFESDTLLDVKSFQVVVDVMSAINGEQLEIVNIALESPQIKILVLESGEANYDIAISDTTAVEEVDTTSSAFSISFQNWSISNANVIYDDRTLPMKVSIGGLNHDGSGDFTSNVFDIITKTTIDVFSLGYDGVEYITNKHISADITLGMDLEAMKFTFKENKLAMNDFAFGLDGFVSMPSEDIDMEINYAGQDINMKSILSLVPGDYEEYLEGVQAAGVVGFDGYVKGTFNETSMPTVLANFKIENGKIDYVDSPVPLEKINVKASFDYPSADLRETSFTVSNMSMEVEGEPFKASLLFKDLEDYYWDLKVDGKFDLAKVTKIVPLEGMSLSGVIDAAMQTSGRMSQVEAEQYQDLVASGSLNLKDFEYAADDFPQGFGIAAAAMTFNPKEIALKSFQGHAGKTDLNMSGSITHYLDYALSEEGVLQGKLDFYSKGIYADEWMTEDTTEVVEDTASYEVVRVPENIYFVLNSKIDLIDYDGMKMENFVGNVTIKDGAIILDRTSFDMLGGQLMMTGSYQSAEKYEQPLFDFDFDIKGLSIAKSFETFNTVKKLAPFAEKMTGDFSANLGLNGALAQDFSPVYELMEGSGLIAVADAALENVKLLQAASNVSALKTDDGSVNLKNVDMYVTIEKGRVNVKPFDLKFGGYTTTISGSAGIDGSLDYKMLMDVPSGKVGDAANSLIGSVTGQNNLVSSEIALTLGVLGTYDDPKVKLLSANPKGGSSTVSNVKAEVKAQAQEKVNEAKEEVKQVVEEKKEEVKEEVKEKVEEKKEEVIDKAKDELKDLFKKKKG